jgi:hypothetical protein
MRPTSVGASGRQPRPRILLTNECVISAIWRMKRSEARTTPDADGYDHVEEDREAVAGYEHEDVAPRPRFQDPASMPGLRHVPSDEGKQGSERGHRDVGDGGREHDNGAEHDQGVHDGCDGGARTRSDVVAVRARAPIAAIPPKSEAAMFASPCPTSSESGSVALTGHAVGDDTERSESIAPSIAMPRAAGRASRISARPPDVTELALVGERLPAEVAVGWNDLVTAYADGRRAAAVPFPDPIEVMPSEVHLPIGYVLPQPVEPVISTLWCFLIHSQWRAASRRRGRGRGDAGSPRPRCTRCGRGAERAGVGA